MGWQPRPDGDVKYGVVVYDSIGCDSYLHVPANVARRAIFGNRYGIPTDIDAVWADRELQQDLRTAK